MNTKLVRLKPFDPNSGCVLRRYGYRGICFKEERGWYRVPINTADYLATVHQVPGNKLTPKAFDVCTPEEARRLEMLASEEGAPARATDQLEVSLPRDEASIEERGDTVMSNDEPTSDAQMPSASQGDNRQKQSSNNSGRRSKRK